MSMPASEHLRVLSEKIGELMHPEVVEDARLVQKGMMLYRQGLVSISLIDENEIAATVQDVVPVKVMLDWTFFDMSTCSCPADGLCRHQLAVFFSAYSREASVAAWLDTWRQPVQEKNVLASWSLQKAKDLVKANGILKPDYSHWIQSFEESFNSLLKSKKHNNPFVVVELFSVYLRRLQASAPVEKEWKLLYDLIATVFSFRRLAELCEELGHTDSGMHRSYVHVFNQMLDDAETLVYKLGVQTMPFAFDEFIEKLKDDSFELLEPSEQLVYERIYLYRLLWTQLFKKNAWRDDELKKIEARLMAVLDWENPLPLLIAGVHINFMRKNDDKALGLIGTIEGSAAIPYLLYWIDLFTKQKAWDRVGPLAELFLQKIKSYLLQLQAHYSCMSFAGMALKSLKPYCAASERIDLYERALLETMPYSYREFEIMLFEQGQFDKWAELQAFIGIEYDQLPKDRLKLLEKEKPEVLMSLLHQMAQQQIELKNRQSYKMAVRQLKKLRTIYKKQKRLDDWQFFFDTLLERTKRLRAFQEECRRSKLIDA